MAVLNFLARPGPGILSTSKLGKADPVELETFSQKLNGRQVRSSHPCELKNDLKHMFDT